MLGQRIKSLLNEIRNFLIFRIRYPWVRRGIDVHCQWTVRFWSPHRHIVLGDHIGIGHGCIFLADAEIGNNVLIACNVAFLNSDDHKFDKIGKTIWDSGRGDKFKIIVEDDVWLGHGAIILSPSRIGSGSIVAAGSVVVKDVPNYSIVAGNPAKVIKMRFNHDKIEEHERIVNSHHEELHALL